MFKVSLGGSAWSPGAHRCPSPKGLCLPQSTLVELEFAAEMLCPEPLFVLFPGELISAVLFICLFFNKRLFWFEIQQKHTPPSASSPFRIQ